MASVWEVRFWTHKYSNMFKNNLKIAWRNLMKIVNSLFEFTGPYNQILYHFDLFMGP